RTDRSAASTVGRLIACQIEVGNLEADPSGVFGQDVLSDLHLTGGEADPARDRQQQGPTGGTAGDEDLAGGQGDVDAGESAVTGEHADAATVDPVAGVRFRPIAQSHLVGQPLAFDVESGQ